MVKLNRIYTRTGDDGSTGLGDGSRVPKHSLRVAAYGDVDEANASIGLAIAQTTPAALEAAQLDPESRLIAARIADVLRPIQHDLFDVGADLCIPLKPGEAPDSRLRVKPSQTDRLEPLIDEFNDHMASLRSFVLPGGSPLAAALHLARTTTRRAERVCTALREAEPDATSPEPVRYLNRLSDLLFVLSRAANAMGTADILWVPGSNR
jgi:cob(I)alamin adenosyltransferase